MKALVATVALFLGILPGLARAEESFAKVTLWEVQEYLRLKPLSHAGNIAFRLANATLVGDATGGLCASARVDVCAMDAHAQSTVNLTLGVGPINGAFNILLDSNPASPLLSDLILVATGTLEGTLDLRPVIAGTAPIAPAAGRWRSQELGAQGSFKGAFLVPVPAPLAPDWVTGQPLDCSSDPNKNFVYVDPTTYRPGCLADSDFSLGSPVTKFVADLMVEPPSVREHKRGRRQ